MYHYLKLRLFHNCFNEFSVIWTTLQKAECCNQQNCSNRFVLAVPFYLSYKFPFDFITYIVIDKYYFSAFSVKEESGSLIPDGFYFLLSALLSMMS